MSNLNTQKAITAALKARVAAIAPSLPSNYKKIVATHYPQYNTIAGGALLDNVKRRISTDAALTEIFEAIADGRLTMQGEPVG